MTITRCLVALSLITACDPTDDEQSPPTDEPLVEPLEPPAEHEGFQVSEGEFTVEPGEETFYCVHLPLPERYGDGPVYVRGIEARLPPFTHHFFMSYTEEALKPGPCWGDDPLRPESEFEDEGEDRRHPDNGGKLLFIAGEGEGSYTLPDGYALPMATGKGTLVTSHHLLNFGDEPAPGWGTFNVLTAPAAEVDHPMNIFNCLNVAIDVPAGEEGEVTATCVVPFDLDLVLLSSHAHQYLMRFEARLFDGENTVGDPFYVSEDWDSPALLAQAEPIHLKAGQGVTYTCHYKNVSDKPLSFGAGDAQEMCAIMDAYAYPTDHPGERPPSLGTMNGDPVFCTVLGPRCCEENICEMVDTSLFDLPF